MVPIAPLLNGPGAPMGNLARDTRILHHGWDWWNKPSSDVSSDDRRVRRILRCYWPNEWIKWQISRFPRISMVSVVPHATQPIKQYERVVVYGILECFRITPRDFSVSYILCGRSGSRAGMGTGMLGERVGQRVASGSLKELVVAWVVAMSKVLRASRCCCAAARRPTAAVTL